MTDETTPLADAKLTEIRLHERAYAYDPGDAPILIEAAIDRRVLLAEVDRLRAELKTAKSTRFENNGVSDVAAHIQAETTNDLRLN